MTLLSRLLLSVAIIISAGAVSAEPDKPVSSAAPVATPTLVLAKRQHPFLFADASTFAAARERAERRPWAERQLRRIITRADAALAGPLVIPSEVGQWSHYYICKKCATDLQEKDGKNVCGKCGLEHTGWPFDQVAAGRVHRNNWWAAETLGLAYALTDDERYAARAREILLAYAGKYRSYPYHDYKGGTTKRGARVFAQTLDESVNAIRIVWGYDLVYNSAAMTPADREAIESGLLRPLVETLRRNDMGISNWQSWHNAAFAAIGFCLQDGEIAALALDGPSGLRFQLDKSVLPDGFWYEGAVSYHYYALNAIRYTAEAALHAGIDFYDDPVYKRLYDAPMRYTFPDLTLPAVNDSTVSSLVDKHPFYEIAYARFKDPRYLPILDKGKRDSVEAFLWGAEELPPAGDNALVSANFAGLGAVVLRQGEGEDAMYVHLDYGPHGGGHGHQDKLAVIFYALGRQIAPDPGTVKYSSPLHRQWYSSTLAHNALVVDGKSQADAEGRLTLFHSEPGFAVARAECDTANPGVRMERTLVLTDRYLLDVMHADSDTTHTWDWAWHNEGTPVTALSLKARSKPLGKSQGYQHVTDVRQGRTSETWSVDFRQKEGRLRLAMAAVAGGKGKGGAATETAVFLGTGMTGRPPSPCPVVIARRKGHGSTWVTVLEPSRNETDSGGATVEIITDEQSGIVTATVRYNVDGRDVFRIPTRRAASSEAVRPVRMERGAGTGNAKVFEAKAQLTIGTD